MAAKGDGDDAKAEPADGAGETDRAASLEKVDLLPVGGGGDAYARAKLKPVEAGFCPNEKALAGAARPNVACDPANEPNALWGAAAVVAGVEDVSGAAAFALEPGQISAGTGLARVPKDEEPNTLRGAGAGTNAAAGGGGGVALGLGGQGLGDSLGEAGAGDCDGVEPDESD